jgi:hypothetical protein
MVWFRVDSSVFTEFSHQSYDQIILVHGKLHPRIHFLTAYTYTARYTRSIQTLTEVAVAGKLAATAGNLLFHLIGFA